MIPTTDEAIRMLMKLSLLKKYGALNEKKTISAISTTISAADSGTRARTRLTRTAWRLAERRRRRRGPVDPDASWVLVAHGHPPASGQEPIRRDLVARELGDDATAGHHERAVGHLDDLLVVGGRDQHPDALRRRARASSGRARRARRRRRRGSARSSRAAASRARASARGRPSAGSRPRASRSAAAGRSASGSRARRASGGRRAPRRGGG